MANQTSAGTTSRSAPAEKRSEPGSPVLMVVGLGALGVLLVILLFRGSPGTELPQEQRGLAMALVEHMQSTGVLMKYVCAENRAYVHKALWDKFNVEQKRGLAIGLATVCHGERAEYRITVFDLDSNQRLANFDGKAFTVP
jgi:hypothetical protein